MRLRHRRVHLLAWRALLVLLPLILGAALWQRAAAPAREVPVRIAPP
ncbi:hypothetical protein KTR66_16655 [Roseococcus sp. SDR]|nr:hypothetical protein [Roseococcus sp. SDR]MBS7791636.1 hypothetical protein [Roseococcus sp. SDR]MBV1846950.1 hypothetical protein [Roseococcus sp. SDR]